jgi:hypothetical protein
MSVSMQDAIALARKVALADAKARAMADYQSHPDFDELRAAADTARNFLWNAGER